MGKKELVILNRHKKRILATLSVPENKIKGTCVVLHGLGGWKEQGVVVAAAAAAVASGYQTLSYDSANSAFGPDADFFHSTTSGDIEDLGDVLANIRGAEWYQAPLVLIGHSMGGLAVMEYVAEHPEEVEKLILCAPAISWKVIDRGFLLIALLWYLRGFRYTPGPHHTKLKLSKKWMLDFFRFDEYENALKISVPVLVIAAGKDSTVAAPKFLARLASQFTEGTYVEITTAPHTFEGHENEVTAIITKWLTQS